MLDVGHSGGNIDGPLRLAGEGGITRNAPLCRTARSVLNRRESLGRVRGEPEVRLARNPVMHFHGETSGLRPYLLRATSTAISTHVIPPAQPVCPCHVLFSFRLFCGTLFQVQQLSETVQVVRLGCRKMVGSNVTIVWVVAMWHVGGCGRRKSLR